MEWKLAEAKQQFSEVVRRAATEPQVILNRDRPVAVLVAADGFADYVAWQKSRARGTMAAALDDLVQICREEEWQYEAPPRVDRPNPLAPATRKRKTRAR